MNRRLILPTLLTALMLPVLLGLGAWQLQRAGWKQGLLADMRARMNLAAQPLPENPAPDWAFRPVQLTCRFPAAAPVLLPGAGPGRKAGYYVFSVCQRQGAALFVNRGWVPAGASPDAPPDQADLHGVVREWPSLSWTERLAKAAELPEAALKPYGRPVTAIVVQSLGPAEAGPGAPAPVRPDPESIPNNHLSYAIQWFSFAAILAVIYGLWARALLRRGESL